MGDDTPDEPIRSTRAGDPEVEDRLDAFVLGLGERLDLLQDADGEQDFRQAVLLSQALAGEASELGYAPLVKIARAVQEACTVRDAKALHREVVALTGAVRRVALGHRGAA